MGRFRAAMIGLFAVGVVLVGYLWLRTFGGLRPAGLAAVKSVPPGDQEIAWIDAATSGNVWERFVAAAHYIEAKRTGLSVDTTDAFPRLTTSVPEIVLSRQGHAGRLWIRWYKLTSEAGIPHWVRVLAERQPPPLAIIGGGSSDRALELAQELHDSSRRLKSPPLLLITTATADKVYVADKGEEQDLMGVYAERSFRFCFTNRQMAEAVLDFIGGQDSLRPDPGPVYAVAWEDDPYSMDLAEQFAGVLRKKAATEPGSATNDENQTSAPFWKITLPYSVGGFDQPNRPEAQAAQKLLEERAQHPGQHRPLLIIPATVQPARRFLRGLVRLAPAQASSFVVATGDSISFNDVFRDRHLNWPIQDLPFSLVFFCHRNPLEEGTSAAVAGASKTRPHPPIGSASGTHELLLFSDILSAVLDAGFRDGRLSNSADQLAEILRADPALRFDPQGNRRSGTGEHLASVRPRLEGGRVGPRANIEVWQSNESTSPRWHLRKAIEVDYLRESDAGERDHVGDKP